MSAYNSIKVCYTNLLRTTTVEVSSLWLLLHSRGVTTAGSLIWQSFRTQSQIRGVMKRFNMENIGNQSLKLVLFSITEVGRLYQPLKSSETLHLLQLSQLQGNHSGH